MALFAYWGRLVAFLALALYFAIIGILEFGWVGILVALALAGAGFFLHQREAGTAR